MGMFHREQLMKEILPQLIWHNINITLFTGSLYIPGGAGSLPSTVCWFSRSFTELRNLLMYIHQQYLRVLQNSTGSQDDP